MWLHHETNILILIGFFLLAYTMFKFIPWISGNKLQINKNISRKSNEKICLGKNPQARKQVGDDLQLQETEKGKSVSEWNFSSNYLDTPF